MNASARSRRLAAVGLLVLVGFLARAVSLDAQSLWRDEVDALRFATAPRERLLDNFTRPGWNGPLYYLLLRGWIAFTGTSEFSLRFFSLLFGVLSVPLIYALGRRLFTPSVGIISAFLVATSPYMVWYSQEVKMYTLLVVLSLSGVYSLRRALAGGGWSWWVVEIAATSLAFYSHILAALLVPVQVVLALVWWPQKRKRWRGALISLACLTLPYLPLAVWQAPLALQTRETGFHPYSLGQMIVILLRGWSAGIASWGGSWAAVLAGLLAAGALINPVVRADSPTNSTEGPEISDRLRTNVAILLWTSLPLLLVWLISLRQPLFTDRYLIWSAPAFYLLVAVALASLASARHWVRWLAAPLLSLILVVNGVNLWQQASTPIKSDFRAAAAYVASHLETRAAPEPPPPGENGDYVVYLPITRADASGWPDLIIFQIPYGRYTFDYYFPIEDYPWAEGLYTNHRTPDGGYVMSEEQAAQQMREMTEDYDTTWLVATEASMWDERNLVQRWLDEQAQRIDEAHFQRVDVYRYALPGS